MFYVNASIGCVGILDDGNVRKWCMLFNESRTNVHEDIRSGQLTVMRDNLLQKVSFFLSFLEPYDKGPKMTLIKQKRDIPK